MPEDTPVPGRFEPDFIAIPYKLFRDPSLSHAAKLLYGRLRFYAGKDGKCIPKHRTLATEVCLEERQVRNVLRELKDAGWVDWTRTKTSCSYTVYHERQKSADLKDSDRSETATESGEKVPVETGEKLPTEKRSLKRGNEKRLRLSADADASAEDWGTKAYPWLTEALAEYMDEPGQERTEPPGRIVIDIVHAACQESEGCATTGDIVGALRYLHDVRKLAPGAKNGPRHWGWFEPVIRDYFGREYWPHLDRSDYAITKEESEEKPFFIKGITRLA